MDVSSEYFEHGSFKLHYYHKKGSSDTLVFAHGLTEDGTLWFPFAEELAKLADFNMYFVDNRGQGKSSSDLKEYSLDIWNKDFQNFLENKIKSPVIIFGDSGGGTIAIHCSIACPDLVKAIVLGDPFNWKANYVKASQNWPSQENFSSIYKELIDQPPTERYNSLKAKHPEWPDRNVRLLSESISKIDLRIFSAVNEKPKSEEWEEQSKKITCPTLLMRVDESKGGVVSESTMSKIERHFSENNIKLYTAIFSENGHPVRHENQNGYLSEVIKFLEGIEILSKDR